MRARAGTAAARVALLLFATSVACADRNEGQTPPGRSFFFPSGLLLDPVNGTNVDDPDPDQIRLPSITLDLPGRHFLYVANGNNDRTYNAGTLAAVDLREFWRSWYEPRAVDPTVQAGCEQAVAAAQAALEDERQRKQTALNNGELYEFAEQNRAVIDDAFVHCDARDLLTGGLDPYCDDIESDAFERCILPPGSAVVVEQEGEPDRPCRRLPLLPHVVECDERPFIGDDSVVQVGDFATTLTSSIEGDDIVRLWLPVRGDPSVTYVDARVDAEGRLSLECSDDGDAPPDVSNGCSETHRLERLRNDIDLDPLDREPFNMTIWERDPRVDAALESSTGGKRLAFVAHADGSQLSMIDLDGVRGEQTPAIVDLAPLYITSAGVAGGFGLAVRPCFAAGQGPLGAADPEPNIPAITQECRRPLVYSSFRFAGQLASFTASGLELGRVLERFPTLQRLQVDPDPDDDREDDLGCMVSGLRTECVIEGGERVVCNRSLDRNKCCSNYPLGPNDDPEQERIRCDETGETFVSSCCEGDDPECATQCDGGNCAPSSYAGQYCATPEQLGLPCAVECEPQVRGSRRILPALLLDTSLSASAVLGDMAFADPRGDQLLVLQTNPGALLSLDTSLGDDGEPLDIPSAPPVEICAEPSRMKIYVERDADGAPVQRYALITCFRAALVYIVDLESLRVVDAVVVGTGPHDIAVDAQREAAYVINNLESSVSVIDLSRRRPTRFQELARLGLQDPFSQ
ncbi:MAG: hypothetical protein AAGF11_51700 [Myxococcota bacterium]